MKKLRCKDLYIHILNNELLIITKNYQTTIEIDKVELLLFNEALMLKTTDTNFVFCVSVIYITESLESLSINPIMLSVDEYYNLYRFLLKVFNEEIYKR